MSSTADRHLRLVDLPRSDDADSSEAAEDAGGHAWHPFVLRRPVTQAEGLAWCRRVRAQLQGRGRS